MRTLFYALIFIALSSCDEKREVTVDDLINDYKVEEIQQLLEIKVDSLLSIDSTLDEEFYELSKTVKIETIQEALDAIYGVDNRIDFYEESDISRINNSYGVIALIENDSLKEFKKYYELNTISFEDKVKLKFENKLKLCEDEKFKLQPLGAFCSGFVLSENLIVTAGHCFKDKKLADIKFVLDFKLLSQGKINTVFPKNLVFTGKKVLMKSSIKEGIDFALIETNELIPSDRVLDVNRLGYVKIKDEVYVIGHPLGLPLKIADGAQVRLNSNPLYFKANLDTYGGNSGSPVFSSITHEVVGILIKGEKDFVNIKGCLESKPCPDKGCKGEDVLRISSISDLIKNELIQ